MLAIVADLIFFGLAFLYLRAALRVLDRLVTRVRAGHGLAMAWGTAIIGFPVMLAGLAALAWVKVLLNGLVAG